MFIYYEIVKVFLLSFSDITWDTGIESIPLVSETSPTSVSSPSCQERENARSPIPLWMYSPSSE